LGIGTERIEEEVRAALPDSKIFRFDKLSAPTHKKATDLADKFYNSPGSIMIGTEYALLYLDKEIDSSAVASLDAFFSIPDFRINEKIFSIILKLRALARKHFLLQTRNPEAAVLSQGVKGNIIEFYREEIEARKMLGFPPFSTFIKISYAGKKEEVLEAMEKLKVDCAKWNVTVFPAFIATIKGEHVMHALIKLASKEWPNTELLELLRNLPAGYAVNVDPESIL
jgi:primosomal protein N' (replication factor Y)